MIFYQIKYLIIGYPRSGTSLLGTTLGVHKAILYNCEVFSVRNNKGCSLEQRKEIAFKNNKGKPNIKAIGFKLVYSQTTEDISNWLLSYDDLVVFKMERRNLLRRCLSYKIAKLTDKWLNPLPSLPQIFLTKNDLSLHANLYKHQYENLNRALAKYKILTIYYEDLCSNFDKNMKICQERLQVPISILTPFTRKRDTRKLSESISNYSELYDSCRGTEFEMYFD